MGTKAKTRLPDMPKLGWKDKTFYLTLLTLIGAGGIFLCFFAGHLQHMAAFSDERVVARTIGPGNIHMLWFPFWLFFVFCLLIFSFQNRTPVFGRSDVRYGPPVYIAKYPLLMKNKPKVRIDPKELARKRRSRIILIAVVFITFLLSISAYLLSISGRCVMHKDGTVAAYDELNRQTECYSLDEISEVRLNTYTERRIWYVEMIAETSDGARYRFSIRGFEGTYAESLQTMLQMKEIYGVHIVVDGRDDLWRVVRDHHLDDEEKALLYELFSMR